MVGKVREIEDKAKGVGRCAWLANGEQCNYPGTVSRNTQGMGPWYCKFHAAEDSSQQSGEEIVKRSRHYQPKSQQDRDHDSVFGVGISPKACIERTCIRHAEPGKAFCIAHAEKPAKEQAA